MRESNLVVPPNYIVESPTYTREDGLSIMPNLINAEVDAIFCAAGDNCA